MRTPDQAAADSLLITRALGDAGPSLPWVGVQALVRDSIETDRAEIRMALEGDAAVPGLRPFPRASVSALVDAWAEFDNDDVSVFTHAWDQYVAGLDFPCTENPAGIHQVTHGSCDLCGDKNRG